MVAFSAIGQVGNAQDVWQLAVEDLPPLDFPDSTDGNRQADPTPAYRLPLPSQTTSEPPKGETSQSGAGSPTNISAGEAETNREPTTTEAGSEDWLSEESIYNEPEEYQLRDFLAPVFSSTDWYRNGCWYVDATASGIWRSSGKPEVLAVDLSGVTPVAVSTPVAEITTRHKGFRFEPGLGLTIGHFLGRDYFNRDTSVEFGFLGLFDWKTDLLLASADQQELFTALNKEGPGGSQLGPIIAFGSHVPLGTTLIPGFDAVDQQEFEYSSRFNSFEINIRLSHRPSRDRMVAMPDGTWSRQLSDGGVPSFFAGMRYIGIEERLLWLSRETSNPLVNGSYDVKTNNALFGLQFGGDYTWVTKTWSAGAMGKAGAYVNFADLRRQIQGTGSDAALPNSVYVEAGGGPPYTFADNLPNLRNPGGGNIFTWNYSGAQRTSVYAVFLESELFAQYNVNPNLSFRMSWDQFWINGLAMAPAQLHFEPARSKINVGGNVYFTGLSVSGQWVW